MAKKINLGKASPAPFATPPAATASEVPNRMPFEPGEIIKPQRLSPAERKVLTALDWQEGDPVPANLPDLIERVKAEAALADYPLPLDTPPLRVPEPVDIAQLPEAKQAELRALLAAAKTAFSDSPPPLPEPASMSPAVAAAARDEAPELLIEDDTQSEAEARKTVQESLEASEEDHLCPRCQWDVRQKDIDTVTQKDKEDFLLSFQNGLRFEKSYGMFGDTVDVRFRTLSPHEVDLCHRQSMLDWHQSDPSVVTQMDRIERALRYQLCLQLLWVRSEGQVLEFPEQLSDWEGVPVPEGQTPLLAISEYMSENTFKTESRLRVFMRTMMGFNRLVTKLESNVENADFWKAASTS